MDKLFYHFSTGDRKTAATFIYITPSARSSSTATAPINEQRSRLYLRGGTANGLGVHISQHADGRPTAKALAELLKLRGRAVQSEDYALAAQLHQLHRVLHPSSRLDLAKCSPETLEEQVKFFGTNGFLVIPDVLAGAELSYAQAAWSKVQEPKQAEWEAEREKGNGFAHQAGGGFASGTNVARRFFDLGQLCEVDDCFVELMDHPKITPVVTHFAGGGDIHGNPGIGNDVYHGIAQVAPCGGRVLPSDTNKRYSPEPVGYLAWHRDVPNARGSHGPLPSFRYIKGFVYLWDVGEDGGCAAVVPGSHLLSDAPRVSLTQPMASGYELSKAPGVLGHEAMPNHVKIAVPAGTCLIFVRPQHRACLLDRA
jgi:hypothetical protein